jgi:hypothetical protein
MGTARCVRRGITVASGNTRLWRRTSRPRRPSATTNEDSRSRRRPGHTRNKTSNLNIKLRLQVPGDGSISVSTNVLHGVVLVICIRRALGSINHSLALSKAIGPAMAPTATTSVRHLQKETMNNQRVREIRYISFSKKYRKHTMIKIIQKKKKREEKKNDNNNNNQNKQFFPRPFGQISRPSLTIKLQFDDMLNHLI